MTSQELKAAKAALISNVSSFIDKYNGINAKLKVVNTSLSSTQDTLLNSTIMTQSADISSKINKAINDVTREQASAIAQIDEVIRRLEAEERLAALRAKEAKLESEKTL